MSITDPGAIIALEEGRAGLAEGRLPVGSAIISPDGEILGRGRNMRNQNRSPILHGETAAFDSNRTVSTKAFKGATIYTTLSPCPMCAGAMIFFEIKKVVIGDNIHMTGREDFLRSHGIEVVVLNDQDNIDFMEEYISKVGDDWLV